MEELIQEVGEMATEYWNETADGGEQIEKIPASIVHFVVEYFFNTSTLPSNYTEDKRVKIMRRYINSMAMACDEVFAKAGAEGQLSHIENSVSRTYKSTWISPELLCNLPNYVDFFF